jgi:hypothetical protein
MVIVALTPDPINSGSPNLKDRIARLTARLPQGYNLLICAPLPDCFTRRSDRDRQDFAGTRRPPGPSGTSFNPAVGTDAAIEAVRASALRDRVGTRRFLKRKAAGWGPGGSRTSAIVSGGWECDRRR